MHVYTHKNKEKIRTGSLGARVGDGACDRVPQDPECLGDPRSTLCDLDLQGANHSVRYHACPAHRRGGRRQSP